MNLFIVGSLPLPQDVPIHFRVLPEFVLEDVIDYLLFIVRYLFSRATKSAYFDRETTFRHSPNSLELSGKNELVIFALTFLTSTWYIKNPFLKAKLVEVFPSCSVLVRYRKLRVCIGTILWYPWIWP